MTDTVFPDLTSVLGRVGQDPESKQVGHKTVTKFSIAQRLDLKKRTQWYDVDVWEDNKFGQYEVAQNVRKGQLVVVEGSVKEREYNGKTYYTIHPINIYRAEPVVAESDDAF